MTIKTLAFSGKKNNVKDIKSFRRFSLNNGKYNSDNIILANYNKSCIIASRLFALLHEKY